jgi:hypothetical protein
MKHRPSSRPAKTLAKASTKASANASTKAPTDPPGLAVRRIAADIVDGVLRRRRPLD